MAGILRGYLFHWRDSDAASSLEPVTLADLARRSGCGAGPFQDSSGYDAPPGERLVCMAQCCSNIRSADANSTALVRRPIGAFGRRFKPASWCPEVPSTQEPRNWRRERTISLLSREGVQCLA